MEIIYPQTKNIIAYEDAYLQFHNLTEFDDNGDIVMTDMPGGATLQRAIQDANAHLQNTFKIIPPQKLKIGRIDDFEDYQDALYKEVDQLKNKYGLKETDLVSEYHKAWWADVIKTKADQLNYSIPDLVLNTLVNRWAFENKSTRINNLVKDIDNTEFANWVTEFDKKDFKQYQKQNIQPFETIFLKLGATVLKNASEFLALNPNNTVQDIRKELANTIRILKQTDDASQLSALERQLGRIQQLGGFGTIVPLEGIVFVYKGNTYKLTGSFAPINQILGMVRYQR
jgi:mannose/fructose-specific phosphotransferase system component IIA